MTGIRRTLVLTALTIGVLIGSTLPASATFSDAASVPTTVSTATVAAPGNLAGNLACGRWAAAMSATWSPSTSTRVSGYLVTVYFSDGFVQTVQLGPTATSWSAPINLYWVTAYSIRYSVTTQTNYGWTTESATTPWFTC